MSKASITTAQKILIAAYNLEQQGHSPFSAELLIVTAWKSDPLTFGLRSFSQIHPDSSKVLSHLAGPGGLPDRGWLDSETTKMYSLTEKGREVAVELLGRSTIPQQLSPEQVELLEHLLISEAHHRLEQHLQHELTFVDACRFWRVNDQLHSVVIDQKLQAVRDVIVIVSEQVGSTEAVMPNGRQVSCGEILSLRDLNEVLEGRFRRHLNRLRARRAMQLRSVG